MSDNDKIYSSLAQDKRSEEDLPSIVLPDNRAKRWYVIRSRPRQEAVCLEEFTRAGFEGLCPLRMEYRFRRRQEEAVPLFPGYVFCRMSYPDDYHSVRWLRGVLHMVQFGESAPPALDDDVMKFFIESMNGEGVIETGPEFVEGDRVQFLTESMKGMVGTVLRIDSAEKRVHVLMDLLYQATIEVRTYQVKAV